MVDQGVHKVSLQLKKVIKQWNDKVSHDTKTPSVWWLSFGAHIEVY